MERINQDPLPIPAWEQTAKRIEEVVERFPDPFYIRNIRIELMEPDWATGDGVFKGQCFSCDAYGTMRARDMSQLKYLAYTIEKYDCPRFGHYPTPGEPA